MSRPAGRQYVNLPRSKRNPVVGAQKVGGVDPSERIEITVTVRPRAQVPNPEQFVAGGPRPRLTREQLGAQFGADPTDIAKVEEFAREHHLSVVESDPAKRVVRLAGTAEAMQAAFHVTLERYTRKGHTFRQRTGYIQVPADLAKIVEGVAGLDDRVQAHAHFRTLIGPSSVRMPRAVAQTFTPVQIAQLYNFPTVGTGKGQTVGIIELRGRHGGGYRPVDLTTYFQSLNIPAPKVTTVSVDGGHNAPTGDPSDPESSDVEVALDIEVVGAIAPGANIVVYFAPNTDQGFTDAVRSAIHDTTNKPSVISISWGAPESSWTEQTTHLMDEIFAEAAAVGVTICCASGDSGVTDSVSDGQAHVDFPASSPNATACGGTHLSAANGKISQETVWNDQNGGATGGGISNIFDLPAWQAQAHVPPSENPGGHVGRGVPDVCGDADPQTGYNVLVDGQSFPVGGTSAVAPLWAGLIALLNEQLAQPIGFLNPLLYQQQSVLRALRDITSGDNSTMGVTGYSAGTGWDACTGLGSPNGQALLQALTPIVGARKAAVALAGVPARSAGGKQGTAGNGHR